MKQENTVYDLLLDRLVPESEYQAPNVQFVSPDPSPKPESVPAPVPAQLEKPNKTKKEGVENGTT